MRIRLKPLAALLTAAGLVVGALVVSPSEAGATPVRPARDAAPAAGDRVLVRFKAAANASTRSALTRFHHLSLNERLGRTNIDSYRVSSSETPASVAEKLRRSPDVEYAEPDYLVQSTGFTNDSAIDTEWGIKNFGQSIQGQSGSAGVDVNIGTTWSTSTGNGVIVGVLDEGVDITHPELSSHIWTNSADCNSNGVDDDHNGYIDDCHGWDFYHGDKSVFDAADGDDHGTHVAGTIAAAANNAQGVAGVAPDVSIMPLKFLGPGGGSTSDAILAIDYARAKGVKVINCSWGGAGFSQALKDAMANSGIVFAVAAGNNGYNIANTPQYPAAFDLPNVVTVAAIDNRGALASFSNYGGTTDVAAPGVDIYSTIPKKFDAPVAVENRNGSNTWRTAYFGFGLEDVVGAVARRDLIDAELTRLGAAKTDPVLLVDDDESISGSGATPDVRSYYTAALSAAGYSNVTVTDVAANANGPNAATMSGKYVIWETGYGSGGATVTTLSSTDIAQLNSFVLSGGKLMVIGADAIYRNESAGFVTSTLGISFQSEGDVRHTAVGATSTTYGGVTIDLSGSQSPFAVGNPFVDNVATSGTFATSVLNLPADPDYSAAYEFKNGTSMATPHVAGVLALSAQAAPSASGAALASYVEASAHRLNSLTGKMTSGGMVDASASVALAAGSGGAVADLHNASSGAATGYRFVASDGGVFAYGGSGFLGSAGAYSLNKPVVAITSTPSDNGYWLVASDGGIFSYGDAHFYGSTGAIKLNQPIVGMASTPSGNGYWLVASDGGIFSYGDAHFYGSTGAIKLNKPIVAMTPSASGYGYRLVASDGGIFNYGDASFYGSAGALKLNNPIVGVTTTPSGNGYWLVASDGGIFSYGDAAFFGSTGAIRLNQPIVAMSR